MTNVVAFHAVCKKLATKHLLEDVSFSIQRGQLTTLIGPNGAGKTTIAKLILGLETPTNGKIIIDRKLKIGYVPQKLRFSQSIPITAGKFLSLLARNSNTENYPEIIEFIDFNSLKNKDVAELSGGQLQKLALAAALLNQPDFIILDEPTQSLDISSQQRFYKLIEEIKTRLQLTIFIISHDLFTVMKNSDQVICLNGHVCCSGKPSDIAGNQDFIKALSSIGFYTHQHDHQH